MEQELKQQFQTLPPELKEYILEGNIIEKTNAVLGDLPLKQEQKDAFGVNIMTVLMRMESLASFPINIRHEMQITQARAEELAKEARQEIFAPVLAILVANEQLKPEPNTQKENQDIRQPAPQKKDIPIKQPDSTNAEAEYKKKTMPDNLDVFKKRLSSPVSNPAQEENVGDEKKEEKKIPSKEEIQSDPYRESID